MEWIADILGYSVKEIVSGEFGSKKDRSITINDPIIKEEIERVLKIVDSACEGSGLTETERKRYKALIKSKIRTILEYATG
jgi:enamine deaminase RidA (YjgF/YER057c/UK114 family)